MDWSESRKFNCVLKPWTCPKSNRELVIQRIKPVANSKQTIKDSKTPQSYKAIIMRFAHRWPWFILSLAVTMCLAILYLRNTTPVYKVSMSIILKDARLALRSGADQLDFALSGAPDNVVNEFYILQSRSMIRKVVNHLDLHTSYIVGKGGKRYDLYKNTPVIVSMNQSNLDTLNRSIALELQSGADKSVTVRGVSEWLSIDTVFQTLPALLPTPAGNISFTEQEGTLPWEGQFRVEIHNPNRIARRYRTALDIIPVSRYALVINLSLKTPYPAKGIDFLNMLVATYNSETIEDNRMEMLNTLNLIHERIRIINEELVEVEQGVERFKLSRGLVDIRTDMHRNMQVRDRYEQQLVQIETQINIINSLNDYLNDPANTNKTIPGSIGITDPMLVATTNEYNRLLLEHQRLSRSMTTDNPALVKLNKQVTGLRSNIYTSINSVLQGLNVQRRDARNQVNMYGGRINSVPTQEREFLELARERHIKSTLFTTLLQKREENVLAMEATASSAKVLDEAMVEGKVTPHAFIVLTTAFLLGFVVPATIVYVVDMAQCRIESRADIDHACIIPVLSEIPHAKEKERVAVKEGETDEMDEAFRMLRTNLIFSLVNDGKVILFTSTVPGEGKTFIAINSAISMALLGKKVLIVGMDLRSPRLNEYMGLTVKGGFTLYLAGLEKDIDQLIVPSGIHTALDVLPAGPIPPNPAELLMRPTLDRAFEQLRSRYDYIFIDTAPVAPVADTLIINRVSDAVVYVCRVNYSKKSNLRFANELMRDGKLDNILLVVNDTHDYQRKYGYGDGYGYEYGNNKKRVQRKREMKNKQTGIRKLRKRLTGIGNRKMLPPRLGG